MSNIIQDQAAGLRRIMAAPAPRIVSILSATSASDKSRFMTNLAATMVEQDNKTLLVYASKDSSEVAYGIQGLPVVAEMTLNPHTINSAIHHSAHGFSTIKLMQKRHFDTQQPEALQAKLNGVLNTLAEEYDVLLVDASLDAHDLLPTSRLHQGEIVIQLTRKAESITDAYALIKRIYGQLGRRNFGIIVDQATDQQAQKVFGTIQQVSKQFLKLPLEYFGAIPPDDHLNKAAQLGRSVIEAFPMANASAAFKRMAEKLDYKSHDTQRFNEAALV